MAYEVLRFPYDGTIDADGHVLEPANLWEDYLEERYVERALRVKTDERGLEYLEIDGKPSARTNKGSLGLMGAMGEEDMLPRPDRRYMDNIPYGGADPSERLDLLVRENLQKTVLYPTIGLLWECELTDPELTLAYHRAYNRWIADFCRDSRGRMTPIAALTLLDPAGSAAELERAVKDGCKGGYVAPFNHKRVPHGHPDHDVLFAKAVELDVPLAIHPTFDPGAPMGALFDWPREAAAYPGSIWVRALMQQAFVSFFAFGTLERFPTLRVGVLEAGSGWIGSFLDRLDAVSDAFGIERFQPGPKASELFRRQCFISGDPDETAAALVVDHVGPDCFMWATDYPHPDHPHTWVPALERFVKPLSPETRRKVLGENVARIYRLD